MHEPISGAERPEPQPDEPGAAPAPDEPDQGGPGRPDESGTAGPPPEQPAGPQPLGVPVTPTGHAEVDDRLARLADADHLAVSGHLPVYEDVHRGLRDTLASLDQQPGPRPAARNDLRS
ncbi:hypothetical protein [Streptomyces niger]|uniref:hypothetical protein n=1 Tax=Streptomyces niger TaxID=66373 RepID=UPI00069C0D8A|nr:hypothetical protein [Streptomyces niger]